MKPRDLQTIGLATLFVAAALATGPGRAAQAPKSGIHGTDTMIHTAVTPAEATVAIPRARPNVHYARLLQGNGIETDAAVDAAFNPDIPAPRPQIRLPRPRPQYFDLRIDMTDMLGEQELTGLPVDEQVTEGRRPSSDDIELADLR